MKKQISYICDSIAVGWMFTSGFTFNPRSKATNIGYLFFAKLKVLSSLTKTEIKRPPIYKQCALEQALNADEH